MIRQPTLLILSIMLLLVGSIANAQDKIDWNSLSFEERKVLQQLEGQWEDLSAERQQRLRRGVTRWQQMQPEERESAQTIQERFQSLSPEQQQLINQRFQQFNGLRPQRQRELRNAQRQFRNMSEDQRREMRQRFESRQAPDRQDQVQRRIDQDIQNRNPGDARPMPDIQSRPTNPNIRPNRTLPQTPGDFPEVRRPVNPDIRVPRPQNR